MVFNDRPTCKDRHAAELILARSTRLHQRPNTLPQTCLSPKLILAVTRRTIHYGYLSDLGECLGDHALTEIRRFQMADKPPSTDNSTPFTKLESSEARNSATVAISSG